MIDTRALLIAYRAACTAADIDPATGPVSAYQVINAQTAARRLARRRVTWWREVEWGAPAWCRSPVEWAALILVAASAQHYRRQRNLARWSAEADALSVPLRTLIARRIHTHIPPGD